MRAQHHAAMTRLTAQSRRVLRLALLLAALVAALAGGVVGLLLGDITFWVVEDGSGIHKVFDHDAPWGEVDEP